MTSKPKHIITPLVLLNPQSEAELKGILDKRWPGPFVPADEFFAAFELSQLDAAFIKSRLGCNRRHFSTAELAAFLWSRSNYHEDFDNE